MGNTDSVARILSLSSLQASQDTQDELKNYAKLTNIQLGKEITVQSGIGGIKEGTVYPADTTFGTIIQDMLGGVPGPDVYLYIGATDNIPTDTTGFTKITGYDINKLVNNGLVKTINVKVDLVTEEGQYPCIAVGREVTLTKWTATAFPMGPLSYNVVDKGNYKIYYLTNTTTASINYTFNFSN